MNIKDYISSGIVEAYVLGLASESEMTEFEAMCTQHPEIKSSKDAFEILIEQNALSGVVQPPVQLKNKIFETIQNEENKLSPVVPIIASGNVASGRNVRTMSRYLAAASIVLLVFSTVLNFYLFRQYKSYSSRYVDLLASQQQLVNNNNNINVRLQAYESAMEVMKNPDVAVVQMPASTVTTSPDPNSLAVVYWNTRTKDVYLFVNNMPQPAQDQQYQLWAIVNGKPVDAGLVTNNITIPFGKMKNIANADAFAVTLEKRGGSSSPQGQMYVLGNVKA